jgi:hypothetical protein
VKFALVKISFKDIRHTGKSKLAGWWHTSTR